ncbi:MAG: hypothetical protein KAQ85_10475, partial [Thermodesulfovibrionia bacterium]|nr:hypothetical protein [Thermodesulfovibrionia bacterium]
MNKEEIKRIAKRDKEIKECLKYKAKLVSGVKDAYNKKKKGKISDSEYKEYIDRKHLGHKKSEWIKNCDKFVSKSREEIREDFNTLIENSFSSQITAVLIVAAALMFLYPFLSSSITGFVTFDGEGVISVDREFNVSSDIILEINEIESFALNGWISKGFSGEVYLDDGASKYLLLDYSVPELDHIVENSSIEFDLAYEEISFDVVSLKVDSEFADDSFVCTNWIINHEKQLCFGNSDCCSLLGLEQDEEKWNETLYLNKGKYNADDRNIVQAQIFYANYSLDPENAYSDIRFSDVKGELVDLFDKLSFSDICGESCNIGSSSDEHVLEIVVESGSVYLSNYSYQEIIVLNSAPVFSSLPNISLA